MGDVDFEVFVGVGFTSVSVQCEGFPLGGKGGVSDKVGEGEGDGGQVWERWR